MLLSRDFSFLLNGKLKCMEQSKDRKNIIPFCNLTSPLRNQRAPSDIKSLLSYEYANKGF